MKKGEEGAQYKQINGLIGCPVQACMWVGGWVDGANACQGSELVLGVAMMQKEFCAGSSHDGEYPRDRQCHSTQEDLHSLSIGTLQALP
jgi:hypothetical protein